MTPTPKLAEVYYSRRGLEHLKKSFKFHEFWGPTLYDAYGHRIETGPTLPIQLGRKIEFFRREK